MPHLPVMSQKPVTRSDAPSPWWMPHRHADRRPILLARNRIRAAIRAWFEARGFAEVEPGCLQVSPGNETHLHAFRTELMGSDLARQPMYLHTSPELAMKKLLAAGEQRIFAFSPVFRNRERGALHAPEFTMLEWYRAGAQHRRDDPGVPLDLPGAVRLDCEDIVRVAAGAVGRAEWSWGGRSCRVDLQARYVDVVEIFCELLAMPPDCARRVERGDRGAIAAFAGARGQRVAPDDTFGDIFSRLVTEIEPHLGVGRMTGLAGYPISQSAFAKPRPDNPAIAERFELYCCGIELANGFAELNDPAEQRRRLEAEMVEKERIYGERYPIDEDFLAALAHMPEAAGCALGFDRLVMLATGAARIDDVLWTPLPQPE